MFNKLTNQNLSAEQLKEKLLTKEQKQSKDLFLNKDEYKPVEEEGYFTFKDKLKLFKQGFNKFYKGNISLFFSFCTWGICVALFYFALQFLLALFLFENKGSHTILNAPNWVLVSVGLLFLYLFGFVYISQQNIITNSLMKGENIIDQKNLIVRFIKQLPTLLSLSFAFFIYNVFALFIFSRLYGVVLKQGGIDFFLQNLINFNHFFLNVFSIAIFTLLVYITFLVITSIPLVLISNNYYPYNINSFAKLNRAVLKVRRMFDLIVPLILIHSFLAFVILLIWAFGFEQIYKLSSVDKATLSATELRGIIQENVILLSPILLLSLSYLNKAKIKSFLLLFFLTENLEDYEDRLTHPLKEKETNKKDKQ